MGWIVVLFVNGVDVYTFERKDSEINTASLYLGNVSKKILPKNMKKTWLYRYVYDSSVDYDSIDIADILDSHRRLIKKTRYKILFEFSKNIFVGLLSVCTMRSLSESLVSNSQESIKWVSVTIDHYKVDQHFLL